MIAVIIILLIACTIPSFLTFNSKKENIQKALKDIASYTFRIDGDIKISLLPLPKVTLNNVVAEDEKGDSIAIHKIVLHPALFSIFSDDIQMKRVAIHDAEFNLNDIKPYAHSKESANKSSLSFPNFELVNTTVIFGSDVGNEFKVKNINAKFNFSGAISKDLSLTSNFAIGQYKYNLDASFKNINGNGDTDNAYFKFYNNLMSFNFTGKLADLFNKPQLDGKMAFSIKGDSTKGYASNKLTQIASRDNVKAAADVLITDALISVSNFEISSNSLINGHGELEWLFGFEQELDASLTFDQINLDTLFPKQEGDKTEEISAISVMDTMIRPLINEFGMDIRNQIFGGVSFKVGEILYNNDKMQNIDLNLDVYNGDLALNHFKFSAPGNTTYNLNGNMSFNDVRPRFEGISILNIEDLVGFTKWLAIPLSEKLQAEKPKLSFTSKIDLIPRSLRLLGIKLSIGNTNIIGKAAFKETGEKRLNTKLTLRINEINTNDFNLSTKVDDVLTNMYLYDNDKYGYKFVEYINDYRWLRTFPLNLNAELLIDKAIYKDKEFTQVHNAFRVTPNNLSFDRFAINSNALSIDGTMGIALTALKPNITIDLGVKDIDWKNFLSLLPNSDDLHRLLVEQSLKQATALKKPTDTNATVEGEAQTAAAQTEPQQVFNFYSLHNFNCKYKLNVEQIRNIDFPVTKLAAQGTINEGVIDVNSLSLGIFNGQLDAKGSVVILSTVPNLNFSYAINNFNPKSALKYFYNLDNFNGYMSANGSIVGVGYNMPMLLYNTKGNINFVGKKVTFAGMDLGEMIKVTELSDTLNIRLEKLKRFSITGDTVFDDIAGNILINKGVASLANISLGTNRSKGVYSAQFDYLNQLVSGKGIISFIPIGTASSLNIGLENKGKMNGQMFLANVDSIVKFLQLRLGSAEAAKAKEEKSQSLLRNRRL